MAMYWSYSEESVEKQAVGWNLQGVRRTGGPEETWKWTVLEEAGQCGKTWSEVKRLAGNRARWRCFTN
jgi:hypothetical protein